MCLREIEKIEERVGKRKLLPKDWDGVLRVRVP